MSLELIKLAEKHMNAYLDFHDAMMEDTKHFVPFAARLRGRSFHEFMEETKRNEKVAPTGFVESSLYVLFEGERIIGACSIRHRLNDKLRQDGGHIGYGIHPDYRQKGYGTILLEKALEVTDKLGIQAVMVTCLKQNIASAKVIRANQGRLEREYLDQDGDLCQAYWIKREDTDHA